MLNPRIQKSWIETYNNPVNLCCYENYYNALVNICKKHSPLFPKNIHSCDLLNTLLSIDPSQCVIQNPDVRLNDEKNRVERHLKNNFTIHDFINFITDTLYDIVLPRSERYCPMPICESGGGRLGYIWYQDISTGLRYMVLECDMCSYTERLDGLEINEEKIKIYPVSKEDLPLLHITK